MHFCKATAGMISKTLLLQAKPHKIWFVSRKVHWIFSYLLICRIIQIRESENLCEVYREDAVAAYDHYSGWINSSEITEYMELSDSDVESPSVLHRFKDDVQDVLDYLDDEPIPTCNAGFFEYDLAEWSKSPKYYDNQLESLCSDAVKSEIELINVIEKYCA